MASIEGSREFIYEVEARHLEGWRAIAVSRSQSVDGATRNRPFALLSDEGPALGGENSAPTPLTYLASALAFCVLTQCHRYATARKLDVDDVQVRVRVRFRSKGSFLARTFRGLCDGFDVDIAVVSRESAEDIATLIEVAHASCYTEDALARPMTITHSSSLNGEPLAVPS